MHTNIRRKFTSVEFLYVLVKSLGSFELCVKIVFKSQCCSYSIIMSTRTNVGQNIVIVLFF